MEIVMWRLMSTCVPVYDMIRFIGAKALPCQETHFCIAETFLYASLITPPSGLYKYHLEGKGCNSYISIYQKLSFKRVFCYHWSNKCKSFRFSLSLSLYIYIYKIKLKKQHISSFQQLRHSQWYHCYHERFGYVGRQDNISYVDDSYKKDLTYRRSRGQLQK